MTVIVLYFSLPAFFNTSCTAALCHPDLDNRDIVGVTQPTHPEKPNRIMDHLYTPHQRGG